MSEEANSAAVNPESEQSTERHPDRTDTTENKEGKEQSSGKKVEKGDTDTITIAYNHEQIPLTREEAARLAQIGKRFEGKEALLQNAETEFKRSGAATVEEFVRSRQEALDKQQVDALVADKGLSEEDARELIRLRQLEQRIRENEQQESERNKMADELRDLKARYPEVDLNNLPSEVAAYAVQHHVPVLVAYENSVLLKQYRKELESAKQQKENETASAGSMHSSFPASGGDSFDALWAKGARR